MVSLSDLSTILVDIILGNLAKHTISIQQTEWEARSILPDHMRTILLPQLLGSGKMFTRQVPCHRSSQKEHTAQRLQFHADPSC
jgi:hypothetical protein